jgi:hypothetical protein
MERSRRNLRVTMVRLEVGAALLDSKRACRDARKIDGSAAGYVDGLLVWPIPVKVSI